jgi:predicted dehydrogenase
VTIRVGVIGIGRRGQEWVRIVRGTSGFELAACVDTDATALRHTASALGVPADRCHESLDFALDAARPDALIVATPLDRHVNPCRTALERGLAVLVEKPFATSLRDARQLQALADQRGVPLLVVQNYRYTRMPRAVRRLVADVPFGRPGLERSRFAVPPRLRPCRAPTRDRPGHPCTAARPGEGLRRLWADPMNVAPASETGPKAPRVAVAREGRLASGRSANSPRGAHLRRPLVGTPGRSGADRHC